ncbi:MAG: hypothetical protein CVU44_11320 [Chloroflexi bacterium HGW-Chloroflexi-6]|nr:MAG: hypothetical protein CVU44_11320 [Chloroflexi bacterium HGW-Chloroflexi-6]
MNIQAYCTIDDILKDAENASGLPDNFLDRFILPASRFIAGEIGEFLPVIETLRFTGDGETALFVPPLLRVTSNITNGDDSLAASEYILRASQHSNRPAWPNGPYCRIDPSPDALLVGAWSTDLNDVVIPGVWGLYELANALGVTVASEQSVSVETLTVADGSKLSPGMMLGIGSEMEFVSGYGSPTSAVTTLSAAIDGSQEEITLTNGALVKIGEVLRAGFEKLKVLDISGNAAYVTRGFDRTKKVTHPNGTGVDVYRTFAVKRACNGSTAAIHTAATAISRYFVPEDVNYLARQIATLMAKKSQGGYAGRAGNPESGESYFMYEFPKDAIAKVKANYRLGTVRS